MWKQGEGQIQYMDQNEGRGISFFFFFFLLQDKIRYII